MNTFTAGTALHRPVPAFLTYGFRPFFRTGLVSCSRWANMTIHSADADHSPAARHLVDMPGERIDRQKRPCRSPAGALPTPLMRAPLPLIGRS